MCNHHWHFDSQNHGVCILCGEKRDGIDYVTLDDILEGRWRAVEKKSKGGRTAAQRKRLDLDEGSSRISLIALF